MFAYAFFVSLSNMMKVHARDNKDASSSRIVPIKEARRFMIDCFKAANVPQENAEAMADVLVAADYRGHQGYGMNKLETYINDILKNSVCASAKPKILKETPSTAWVDGQNGLGAVVGNFCMDLAIEKAKLTGVGWVCAKRSNNYGMAQWYVMRAMKNGMIGVTMSNASPVMPPTRARCPALGSNNISVGAPNKCEPFLFDMTTTMKSVAAIEMKARTCEKLNPAWICTIDGKPPKEAEEALNKLCLTPLGGTSEETSGYKGYGLACVADILSGVCSGANFGLKIPRYRECKNDTENNLGQMFVAVDPSGFAPGFEHRLRDFVSQMRNLKPVDPRFPVLLPGDKEAQTMEEIDKVGGIQYTRSQWETCECLSDRLGVAPLKYLNLEKKKKKC